MEVVGPLNKPVALKDTGLRIDDNWHRALKKEPRRIYDLRTWTISCCSRTKKQISFKPNWRQWMIASLAKGNHSRFEFSMYNGFELFQAQILAVNPTRKTDSDKDVLLSQKVSKIQLYFPLAFLETVKNYDNKEVITSSYRLMRDLIS